jgi:Spy/CpxP family protein refolding chaperone
MRKLFAVLATLLVAGGCDNDSMAPTDDGVAATLQEMAALAYGSMQISEQNPGAGLIERLGQLPAEIALTEAQIAHISALVQAFIAATAADREALAAIRAAAADARSAGKSPEEVRAILAGGLEIRRRLREAEVALHRGILASLTPAQRAWLANRPPPQPRPCALTEDQRTEISGLMAAFEQANADDIALVRAVHERARAAHQAGASRQEIAAILAEAREAVQRLRAAREALRAAIQAVLTPEQQAAGCFRR